MIDVTIVLPTKNGATYLEELFEAVWSQQSHYRFEMVVVDSGSTDGSLDIIRRFPVHLVQIPPHEFNHGETRNFGASHADPDSRYIVFLTQDATPLPGWLDALIDPMEQDANLAGTFSRHVPRADCNLPLARRMTTEWEQAGRMQPILKRIEDQADFEQRKAFYCYFSDTSSALRRSVWQAYPFRRVEFGEDTDWAERVLHAGFSLLFQPASAVLHSHSYPLWAQFTQNVDHAKGMVQLLGNAAVVQWSWQVFWRHWWEYTRLDFIYAGLFPMRTRDRLIWILYSALWEWVTLAGNVVGVKHDRLPRRLIKLLSHQRRIKQGRKQPRRAHVTTGASPFISRAG